MKSTKGPWRVAGRGNGRQQLPILGPEGEIAVLTQGHLADAHLIAAAPAMYAILKRIIDRATAPMSDGDIDLDDVREARAALSAARGER